MQTEQDEKFRKEENGLRHRPTPIATRTKETEDSSPSDIDREDKHIRARTLSPVYSFLTDQRALCSLPILILVLIASLDNADKQLLASSFPMLEQTLKLDVKTLGYFSLFSNLSYALSLPFWGYSVHRYGIRNIHVLLSGACASWGFATIGIAFFGSSILGQATMRAVNGAMLGSILPLSQTLLVELVSVSMRGRAFGWMGLCEKLAGTLSAASVFFWAGHWQYSYWILGIFSIFISLIADKALDPTRILGKSPASVANKDLRTTKQQESTLTLKQISQRILRLPAFCCMVAQGIFGGTPWDMMSFLFLLMNWRGFTNEQVVSIQFTSGISATVGGWLGGVLGDYAAARRGPKGRIFVAFLSVAGGIPLYGFLLYSKTYHGALLWINLFNIWGTWPPPAALRPICADLTRNSSERAQIISMWIVLEKASGALFGAPLVGYLTSNMLGGDEDGKLPAEKANVLAFHLCFLSTLFWSICAFFWIMMGLTIQKSLSISDSHDTKESGSGGDAELNALV